MLDHKDVPSAQLTTVFVGDHQTVLLPRNGRLFRCSVVGYVHTWDLRAYMETEDYGNKPRGLHDVVLVIISFQ